jgi:uncharacterized caspase-like protein
MRNPALLFVVVASLLASSSTPARAERLAVVIGNNVGQGDDLPLRFAEDDAVRVGDALVATGGFDAGDVSVLRGADVGDVRRAVLGMNEQLRQTSSPDSMLVVYYSGHSDARALHIGDGGLPLRELEQMVRSSAARFRVLIVDSCRSGVLTRAKGGRATAPVDISASAESVDDDEGLVILTSAAAGEDAQESDALQGSFFTHHLVSALLGAADDNADEVVTLDELYRYAWQQTIRDSSQTLLGVQHPGYRYDLRGTGDIVLARLRTRHARGLLRIPEGVDVMLFSGDRSGRLAAEFRRSTRTGSLAVRPGRYFVRARGERVLWEGPVDVDGTTPRVLELDQLERVDYARLARKGPAGKDTSAGPVVGAFVRSPLTGDVPCVGGVVGADIAVGPLLVAPRIGSCGESFAHEVLSATTAELHASVGVDYVFDLPGGLAVGVGPEVGAAYLHQTFDAAVARTSANRLGGPLVGAHGSVAWTLPLGFTPTVTLFARTYVLPVERSVAVSEVAALFVTGGVVTLTRYF